MSGSTALNDGFAYAEHVGAAAAGRSVLRHLAMRHRHSSADEWRRRLARGEVVLDDAPAAASDRLRAGQRLVWHRPPWCEPAAPLDFAVLYRDADVLVVAKPRDLPTMPAGGYHTHTLQWQVRRRFPDAVPAHRLGRGTSGLVAFARSAAARRGLPRAWSDGSVARVYRALVRGRVAAASFVVDVPIGLVPHPTLGTIHAACAGGKPARTRVQALVAGDAASLVEVAIETGRPDQIRIHLAAAGHPLAGDRCFGLGGLPRADARPGEGGYLLHATRLAFPHPRTAAPVVVECPPPAWLREEPSEEPRR
jgi:23S rRNA pseudouridine1911/1915/1917 synthase